MMTSDPMPPARQAWDDAAEGWSRHTPLIRRWLSAATAQMLDRARIGPGDRVLDVAAGAADQTMDIVRRTGPLGFVLATDLSARLLALADANLRAAGVIQAHTRQADAQALGMAGARFDAVVCRLGLMFCAVPLQALQGIHSALAPGGRFSALVFSQPQNNPCVSILMRTACRHAGVPPPDPFAPGSLLSLGRAGLMDSLMQAAGFGQIEVQALAAPLRTARCEDYVAFLRDSAAPAIELLKPLAPDARAAAWADIADQLAQFTTADGWEGPNELLLCSATRPG